MSDLDSNKFYYHNNVYYQIFVCNDEYIGKLYQIDSEEDVIANSFEECKKNIEHKIDSLMKKYDKDGVVFKVKVPKDAECYQDFDYLVDSIRTNDPARKGNSTRILHLLMNNYTGTLLFLLVLLLLSF